MCDQITPSCIVPLSKHKESCNEAQFDWLQVLNLEVLITIKFKWYDYAQRFVGNVDPISCTNEIFPLSAVRLLRIRLGGYVGLCWNQGVDHPKKEKYLYYIK